MMQISIETDVPEMSGAIPRVLQALLGSTFAVYDLDDLDGDRCVLMDVDYDVDGMSLVLRRRGQQETFVVKASQVERMVRL